jgi:hypothetical protein
MSDTELDLSDGLTPEERVAVERHQRKQDALCRSQCDMLACWRTCGIPVCRRNHRCLGDAPACFKLNWELMEQDEREYLRGCFEAAASGGLSEAEIICWGLAARETYLKHQDTIAAASAARRPAQSQAQPDPQVRIRRL